MQAVPPSFTPKIGRQVALGFGLVSVIAVGMCGALLVALTQVAGLVEAMRDDESRERQSLALAASVREQYMHIAHTLIEGDEGHLDHYGEAKARVDANVADLMPLLTAPHTELLEAVRDDSRAMDELFVRSTRPAVASGDDETGRRDHRQLDRLSERAARNADVLARAVDSHMASMHEDATRAVRAGLAGGGVCVLLVILAAVGFTVRLRTALLEPLAALTKAASRYGAGDFAYRVGDVGQGELRTVSLAFDHMAAELGEREALLLQQERMAAIGQLAAGVAHEINNPIGIIRGYLKMMRPDGDPEELSEELRILDEEAAACQRICSDLLTFATTPKLVQRDVDMVALVEASVERLREHADASERSIMVDAAPGNAYVDADRVRQVLGNLVHNALQATPPHGSVEVVGRPTEHGYRVDVVDQGPGVALEDRERIFEPFYTSRPGGSGLGLAISRSIVRAHGGEIRVTSLSSGGSFCVEFPSPLRPRDRGSHGGFST